MLLRSFMLKLKTSVMLSPLWKLNYVNASVLCKNFSYVRGIFALRSNSLFRKIQH